MMLHIHTPSFVYVIAHGYCANVLIQGTGEDPVLIKDVDRLIGSPATISMFHPTDPVSWKTDDYKSISAEDFARQLRLCLEIGEAAPLYSEVIGQINEVPDLSAPPSARTTEDDLEERESDLPTEPLPSNPPEPSVPRISQFDLMAERVRHPSDDLDAGWDNDPPDSRDGLADVPPAPYDADLREVLRDVVLSDQTSDLRSPGH